MLGLMGTMLFNCVNTTHRNFIISHPDNFVAKNCYTNNKESIIYALKKLSGDIESFVETDKDTTYIYAYLDIFGENIKLESESKLLSNGEDDYFSQTISFNYLNGDKKANYKIFWEENSSMPYVKNDVTEIKKENRNGKNYIIELRPYSRFEIWEENFIIDDLINDLKNEGFSVSNYSKNGTYCTVISVDKKMIADKLEKIKKVNDK
tara:strand:- start:2451 stop:3071 length:621 start_codon:yes stop_codon:yes gene_type:complete